MGSRWDQYEGRINSGQKINDLAQEVQPAVNTTTNSTTHSNTTAKNTL